MNKDKIAIYNALSTKHYISVSDLSSRLNIKPRSIRLICTSMVEDDGLPLISSNKRGDGSHGYKLASSAEELISASKMLRYHADSEYHHAFKLDTIAKEFEA